MRVTVCLSFSVGFPEKPTPKVAPLTNTLNLCGHPSTPPQCLAFSVWFHSEPYPSRYHPPKRGLGLEPFREGPYKKWRRTSADLGLLDILVGGSVCFLRSSSGYFGSVAIFTGGLQESSYLFCSYSRAYKRCYSGDFGGYFPQQSCAVPLPENWGSNSHSKKGANQTRNQPQRILVFLFVLGSRMFCFSGVLVPRYGHWA